MTTTIEDVLAGAGVYRRWARTDAGNGEFFAFLHADRLRYDHQRKAWLEWAGHWWQPDRDGHVHRLAKEAARKRYLDAAELDERDDREKEARWAIATESRARLEAMLARAQSEQPLADDGAHWDVDPWLLGVANGVVDLRTGERRDGQPADRITMRTPVGFDAAATCPRFEQFMSEVFGDHEEIVGFVQRALGYSLTAMTNEQCLFLCYGTGSNGKSTLMRVFRALAGEYAYNMPFTTLELQARGNIPSDVADLVGRRLVTSSETNESARLNEARIKALTGEDPITARQLYERLFTFVPVAKFWLSVNHKPRVADDSQGFWRRIRLVPFTRSFSDDPRAERKKDKDLFDKLYLELPGILNWGLRGCLAWQQHGLEVPEIIVQMTEQYRQEADQLAGFLADYCVQRPGAQSLSKELLKAYTTWTSEQHIPDKERLSSTSFGRRMGERFPRVHTRDGNSYSGVGLLSAYGEGFPGFDADPPQDPAEPGEGFGGSNASSREGNGADSETSSVAKGYTRENPRNESQPFTDAQPFTDGPDQDWEDEVL